ncbi:unnamed protein product [Pedinophyceae sp. YPF-701]|nr:unnamed protein product [Pedinophyceae sp. YPF-701]
MAWRSHGRDNETLVEALTRNKILRTPAVAEAMRAVDRGLFAPPGIRPGSMYEDAPQPIGFSATISAPHMHAHCLELLRTHLAPGMAVLDIGSGSGYLLAVMAHMVGPTGKAVGVEHVPELVERSSDALSKMPEMCEMAAAGSLQVVCGDGFKGYPPGGPYDAIHVGAAAPHVPAALAEQLKPGGRMIIPVGREGEAQDLVEVEKDSGGTLRQRSRMGVVYVPLTTLQHQTGRTWR